MNARWLLALPIAAAALASATYCCVPPTPHVPPVVGPAEASVPPTIPSSSLRGFFDLHAHPLSSLGFAGKLMYGGVDFAPGGGALLPADPDCNKDVRAKSLRQALGHDESTHGSWGLDIDPVDLLDGKFGVQNSCGDAIRQLVISALQAVLGANNPPSSASGDPGFPDWPVWSDVTHQAMYIDWIQRAHDHGLSVMVAFTVNNETLADTVAGPGDSPDDDKASSDLQIAEIKNLASRHADWMEVAYNSDDLHRIVSAGKLALVLGLEVDNIGDFNRKPGLTIDDVKAEITRLYAEGVRYLFPVHLIDNPFGTTAAYQDIFNLSNLREAGHFWNLVCANAGDNVTYRYALGNPLTETLDLDPPSILTAELAAAMVAKLGMLGDTYDPPIVPTCPAGIGMVNSPGLTELGRAAIQEMMRQGMILDVDHMSQASVNDALSIAEAQRYPVNSGHNTVRRGAGTERALTAAQYARIGRLHGMAGVGSAQTRDSDWLALYQDVAASLGRTDGIGFGTDASGLSPLMPPPPAHRFNYAPDFPKSSTDGFSWDYNDAGVAHYGMIADFLHGLPTLDGGATVVSNLQTGAQYFYETWRLVEAYREAHGLDAGAIASPGATDAGGLPAALASRVCPDHKQADLWGVCVKAGAKPVASNTRASSPAPLRGTADEATLTPGAYTLVLVTGDPSTHKRAGFNVEVTAIGRRITLRPQGGKPGAKVPKATGGFRREHFVMRIDADDQVLMLSAKASRPGTLNDVRGAFVAHTGGRAGVGGIFALKMTSTLSRTPTGVKAYGELPTFLAGLHAK